jgi:hypothetical protein
MWYTEGSAQGKYNSYIESEWRRLKEQYGFRYLKKAQMEDRAPVKPTSFSYVEKEVSLYFMGKIRRDEPMEKAKKSIEKDLCRTAEKKKELEVFWEQYLKLQGTKFLNKEQLAS